MGQNKLPQTTCPGKKVLLLCKFHAVLVLILQLISPYMLHKIHILFAFHVLKNGLA